MNDVPLCIPLSRDVTPLATLDDMLLALRQHVFAASDRDLHELRRVVVEVCETQRLELGDAVGLHVIDEEIGRRQQ